MTTMVLASSFLSASLLSMLVPIATVVAIVAWGVVLIRRHERRRDDVRLADRSAGGSHPVDGSQPSRGD